MAIDDNAAKRLLNKLLGRTYTHYSEPVNVKKDKGAGLMKEFREGLSKLLK